MVATTPKTNPLQSPGARANNAKTRTANVLAGMTPDEQAAFRREMMDVLGVSDATVEEAPADTAARAVFRHTAQSGPDYDTMVARQDYRIGELLKLSDRTLDPQERSAYLRSVDAAREMLDVIEAAKLIPTGEKRTFGLKADTRGLLISGRESDIGDIHFKQRAYTTDNPLHIARLYHYMEHRKPGEAQIDLYPSGHAAVVERETGDLLGFFSREDAKTLIANNGGKYRFPRN